MNCVELAFLYCLQQIGACLWFAILADFDYFHLLCDIFDASRQEAKSLMFDDTEPFLHGVLERQLVVEVYAAEYCYYVEQCADEHGGMCRCTLGRLAAVGSIVDALSTSRCSFCLENEREE